MNKTQLSAIMQIVKKLEWNDMPLFVALDAIQLMVKNYISGMADCTEDIISEETALSFIASLDVDNIWLTLFIYDYNTLNDDRAKSYALLLRYDVEECMRNGYFFSEARREWDV